MAGYGPIDNGKKENTIVELSLFTTKFNRKKYQISQKKKNIL